jgi:hypothetical protein
MSRHLGDAGACLRFDPIVGFQARCHDCARRSVQSWWPITLEFWDPRRPGAKGGWQGRSMKRCRACWKAHDARMTRRRRLNPTKRDAENARNARYRAECRDAIRIQQRARRRGTVAA